MQNETIKTRSFKKVLVANRGEIAIRVFRTLRDLNIQSVAIYSDADRDALHPQYADEAFCIGGDAPATSYLRDDVVLRAAEQLGVDAIHPGYGFLAENSEFAARCEAAGITFIGPSSDAINAMGSKTASRELMQNPGVPVVPGTTTPLSDFAELQQEARRVGYPIAVKASAGGGGRGFRVALNEDELQSAWDGARGEGERYFSDPSVYVEKYLAQPRHIEVQVLADSFGNAIHLGERDCSIQRRHQKLVEECPAPGLTDEQRSRLFSIALGAVKATGYTSAGTIECLLDSDGNSYFLEMNTRVQVEHTVTEVVTGIDIVAEQIRIAEGKPLSVGQTDVVLNGHAIEVRVNAEDALDNFRPCSGKLSKFQMPQGPFVRVDAGYKQESEVSQWYDNLVAKIIVWGRNRSEAVARLQRVLDEAHVEGIETLIPFFKALVKTESFIAAEDCSKHIESPEKIMGGAHPQPESTVKSDGSKLVADEHIVEVDGRRFEVTVWRAAPPTPPQPRPRQGTAFAAGNGQVAAPIPGNVVSINVDEGESVQTGDLVCVLEAMKMENEIAAPASGLVSSINVSPGQAVAAGELLLCIET